MSGGLAKTDVSPVFFSSFKNKYNEAVLSVLAALAQTPNHISQLFWSHSAVQSSSHRFTLKHQGTIRTLQLPKQKQADISEIEDWLGSLEEARRQILGIDVSTNQVAVASVLQEFTLTPPTCIKVTSSLKRDELQSKIGEALKRGQSIIATTHNKPQIQWQMAGISPSHSYTVIMIGGFQHAFGHCFQVIKLRNATNLSEEYRGQGSLFDHLFWDQVEDCSLKRQFLKDQRGGGQGIVFMLLGDFIKYFDQVTIGNCSKEGSLTHYELSPRGQHGQFFSLQVNRQSVYTITMEQYEMANTQHSFGSFEADGWSRSTLMLISVNSTNPTPLDYSFINGTLRYNEQINTLQVSLKPGHYLLYSKLDPTIKQKNLPLHSQLMIYHSQPVLLSPLKAESNIIFRHAFMNHARQHKRQQYMQGRLWSAWKLIPNGGYAYMGFGNQLGSGSKFIIRFDQNVFNQQNYWLKPPYSGKNKVEIEVKPGEEEIILLRIRNSAVKQISFPPHIDLQIVKA